MITLILLLSVANLLLNVYACVQRERAIREQRKLASDNTSHTPHPLEDRLGARTGAEPEKPARGR